MRNRRKIKFQDMPFYPQLKELQSKTKLDTTTLLLFQVGFKADPSACECGHEWSIYDLILEAVRRGEHDWEFYKNRELIQEPHDFFVATESITCPKCGEFRTTETQYHYGGYIYHQGRSVGFFRQLVKQLGRTQGGAAFKADDGKGE